MVAYFRVQVNGRDGILRVDRVRNLAQAADVATRIRQVHADVAELLSLEEESLHYTVSEIMNERNLLGGALRYSTGTRTVTIPEKE
jgi:hypothetical protein